MKTAEPTATVDGKELTHNKLWNVFVAESGFAGFVIGYCVARFMLADKTSDLWLSSAFLALMVVLMGPRLFRHGRALTDQRWGDTIDVRNQRVAVGALMGCVLGASIGWFLVQLVYGQVSWQSLSLAAAVLGSVFTLWQVRPAKTAV